MAYEKPQVTVDQNMTITPTSIEREQPAFIFGPNYQLYRYENSDEKSGTSIGQYNGSAMTVKYPGVQDHEAVDKTYTKLFGDSVVISLASLDQSAAKLPEWNHNQRDVQLELNGGYTKILFEGKAYVDYSIEGTEVTRDTNLKRNLVAGDILQVKYKVGSTQDDAILYTRVVDVQYSINSWDIDSSSYEAEGSAGTMVTIEDPISSLIYHESGSVPSLVSVVLVEIQNGVEFPSRDPRSGHAGSYLWKQGLYQSSSGEEFNGVKVNSLCVNVVGYDPSADPVSSPDYHDVLSADLFVTYRELLSSYTDTLHTVTGSANVEDLLGTIDKDNPLAMGVYMAALNSVTDDGDEAPPVYFMAVKTDDLSGYNDVLEHAESNDKVYTLAPTTRDNDVLEAVKNHVQSMSAKTVKQWRIGAGCAEIPEQKVVLDNTFNVYGVDFFAIPISDSEGLTPSTEKTNYYTFRIVKSKTDIAVNDDASLRSRVVKGDIIRFCYRNDAWGDEVYDSYTVKKVENNAVVIVTENITNRSYLGQSTIGETTCYTPNKIEIYHPYTKTELAGVIANTSSQMKTRRMLNVFPSVFERNGVTMSGEFAACAVAGLISATEPQQPITNVSISGIDNIPLTYETYNRTELNEIAAGGTFIVTQDEPEATVYVRHQITTAYPDGNLNTGELSITKNVDSISYAFAEVFKPYIGKFNITPGIIATFENLAGQLIDQLGHSESIYGPQLITDDTKIKYVRQSTLMKDHADIAITLGVPYPCNNIDIVLTV